MPEVRQTRRLDSLPVLPWGEAEAAERRTEGGVSVVRDSLDVQVDEAERAARAAIARETWLCSDGHPHPRPETFTVARLRSEVMTLPEARPWTGAVVALGIYRMIADGTLTQDARLRLSVASHD